MGDDASLLCRCTPYSYGAVDAVEQVPLGVLEDENRRLREAVKLANLQNATLAQRRQLAETRSKVLEEENRRAALSVLHDYDDDNTTATVSTVRSPNVASFSVGSADVAEEEARHNLLTISAEAERRLDDLLTRRQKLEALVRAADSKVRHGAAELPSKF